MSCIFQWVQAYLLQHMFLAPFLYVVSHVLLAVCLIPCSPMTVIAGVLWGKWLGLVYSIAAAFLSCCTTFVLSRFFVKKKIYTWISRRYQKIDWFLEQANRHDWKFVAAVQINPAAPASTLGYLFGLTHIDFWVYAKYVMIFMLPMQLILVTVGDSVSNLYDGRIFWNVFELGMVLGVSYWIFKRVRSSTSRGLSADDDVAAGSKLNEE